MIVYLVNNTIMFQVKWFCSKKGYGFVEDSEQNQYFVHHSDIQVSEGFRYLRDGEYIEGLKEPLDDGRVKIAQIKAPMENGKLMCEVERRNRRNMQARTGTSDTEQTTQTE